MAVQDGLKKAGPVLLEPFMMVEVLSRPSSSGDIIGDLNMRRGKIEKIENRPDAQVMRAMVPLAEMFGYSTRLRSMSQGRAIYSMEFASYVQVSPNLAKELTAKLGGTYRGQ